MCVQDKEYEVRQLQVFLEMLKKGLFNPPPQGYTCGMGRFTDSLMG